MSNVFVILKMCYVHNQCYDISCATLYMTSQVLTAIFMKTLATAQTSWILYTQMALQCSVTPQLPGVTVTWRHQTFLCFHSWKWNYTFVDFTRSLTLEISWRHNWAPSLNTCCPTNVKFLRMLQTAYLVTPGIFWGEGLISILFIQGYFIFCWPCII